MWLIDLVDNLLRELKKTSVADLLMIVALVAGLALLFG